MLRLERKKKNRPSSKARKRERKRREELLKSQQKALKKEEKQLRKKEKRKRKQEKKAKKHERKTEERKNKDEKNAQKETSVKKVHKAHTTTLFLKDGKYKKAMALFFLKILPKLRAVKKWRGIMLLFDMSSGKVIIVNFFSGN